METHLSLRAKIWWGLLGVAGICAFAGLAWFITTLGPKRPMAAGQTKAPDDPVAKQLVEEVAELEKIYQAGVDSGAVTDEALDALKKAMGKQRELVEGFSGLDDYERVKLTQFAGRYDSEIGKRKLTDIARLRDNAELAEKQGKEAAAKEMLQEALKLVREVNKSQADATVKNFGLETSLTRAITALDAAPVWRKMVDAEEEAKDAMKEKRWADALLAYKAAHELQKRINFDYDNTRYADLRREESLKTEVLSLDAAPMADVIETRARTGEKLFKEGRMKEAADEFAAAREMQLKLNLDYPKSRFVSSERVEGFDAREQTALSAGLAEELKKADQEMSAVLMAGDYAKIEGKVNAVLSVVNRLYVEYPKNQWMDAPSKLRYAYLGLKKADVQKMQEQVRGMVAAVPGEKGIWMAKTEVAQTFYSLVMGNNPSRNPGRTLPVDSVTWEEAQVFCTRLSWVMGLKVRLPLLKEFRAAVSEESPGRLVAKDHDGGKITDTTGGAPNAKGFSDLLGNVAEWLQYEGVGQSETAYCGGSYMDEFEKIKKLTVVDRVSKKDRLRTVGFRFVVELPAAGGK